jgi:ligand-binding SRPBCC domain-containing protein
MVNIRSMMLVNAPMERCFQLARSIDLQSLATQDTPVEGVTSGLIGPGETVTWQRRGFGWGGTTHRSVVERSRPPIFLRQVLTSGWFTAFEHDRHFAPMNDGTRIRDEIRFTAPLGLLGRIAEWLFLRRMVLHHLQLHNATIKRVAESEEWQKYLAGQPKLETRTVQSPAHASTSRQKQTQSNVA